MYVIVNGFGGAGSDHATSARVITLNKFFNEPLSQAIYAIRENRFLKLDNCHIIASIDYRTDTTRKFKTMYLDEFEDILGNFKDTPVLKQALKFKPGFYPSFRKDIHVQYGEILESDNYLAYCY